MLSKEEYAKLKASMGDDTEWKELMAQRAKKYDALLGAARESEWTLDDYRTRYAELVTENERQMAQWNAIPWDDLGVMLMHTGSIDGLHDFRAVVIDWANNNRPEGER